MGSFVQLKELFEKEPWREWSTAEIIKHIYPEEYNNIKSSLYEEQGVTHSKTIAKRHKGTLHRRVLYHLNRLVETKAIEVCGVQQKGEKLFRLHPQMATTTTKNATTINPLLMKLERYKEQNIIAALDYHNWHSRLNAVLLNPNQPTTLEELYVLISKVIPVVNDVIGVYGFERFVKQADLHSMIASLKKLDTETKDTNKTVSCILRMDCIDDEALMRDYFTAFSLLAPSRIHLILSMNKKYVDHHHTLLKHIISLFCKAKIKINIHNTDVNQAPPLQGRAGIYTITDEEWNTYIEQVNGKTIGICYAQYSVAVDVLKFFSTEHSITEFRSLMQKIVTSLVKSSALQRKSAKDYFRELNSLQKEPYQFFLFANNYIRLWNYDVAQAEQEYLLDLLESCAADINTFCRAEETIYKSCGFPIRCNTILASSFSKFSPSFSKRQYTKMTIRSIEDLSSKENNELLNKREQLVKLFHGADRLRIFHIQPKNPIDIIHEIHYLMSTYAFPLISYDFAQRQDNLTLDYFMD